MTNLNAIPSHHLSDTSSPSDSAFESIFQNQTAANDYGPEIDYKIKAYNELIGDYSDELGFDKTIKLLNQIGYTIDKESWHDEDRLPDIESLGCIIEFLIQNPELEVPFLTTGGDGYFNAIWQKDRKHRVSIDFFPNNKTRWAFICIVPKSRESLGGNIPLESLFGRLENIGATKWMK